MQNHQIGAPFVRKRRKLAKQWYTNGNKYKTFISGQNRQKSSLYECIIDNMALYFECRVNRLFLAILYIKLHLRSAQMES